MNKILGVGCDLVEIERIKDAIQKNSEGFLQKVLTDEEIRYCKSFQEPYSHAAARFCAKEAVSKALGCGIGKDLKWHDVHIHLDHNKKPHVHLSQDATKRFPNVHFEISLSHTEKTACAFVIAFS